MNKEANKIKKKLKWGGAELASDLIEIFFSFPAWWSNDCIIFLQSISYDGRSTAIQNSTKVN